MPPARRARPAPLPEMAEVALAAAADKPPSGKQWLHEVKYDGYRMLCRVDGDHALFLSRTGKDWTSRLVVLMQSAHRLSARQALLDGEAAVVDRQGATNFQLLQNALQSGSREIVYFVFDLLHLDGRDVSQLPLERRRALLRQLLQSSDSPAFRFSEELDPTGANAFQQAERMGAEGIVSKLRDSPYRGGRSGDWLKVKCLQSEDLVIGGFTASTNPGYRLGALLLGAPDESGLRHVGRVGTGFSLAERQRLAERLEGLARQSSPFANLRRAARGVTFVEPQLIAHVEFGGWTDDGKLRHARYRGLREDLTAVDLATAESPPTGEQPAAPATEASSAAAPPAVDGQGAELATRTAAAKSALAAARITSPARVVYPESQLTKYDVASYYAHAAAWMLPHVAGRPLSLVRCPRGLQHRCFFQKHAMKGLSDSVLRVPVPTLAGQEENLAVRDAAGLLALVQFGVLELHVWGARLDDLERPDRMVLDLDPHPDLKWHRTVAAAFRIRKRLEQLGLRSLVKTTGGRGLHVVVPLRRRHTWQEVHDVSQRFCSQLAAESPREFTVDFAKSARGGKILLDYLRNTRGATSVAAYSTRARRGSPVSVPVSWEELESLQAGAFTIAAVRQRMETLPADPWDQIDAIHQWITKAACKRLGM